MASHILNPFNINLIRSMKRILFLLFLLVGICSVAIAQEVASYLVKGVVEEDKTKEKIEYASIRVLNAADSSYVQGIATTRDGSFQINLKPAKYILQISYLGFLDSFVSLNLTADRDLLSISLQEDAVSLSEAVVEAEVVEILVRGDTVEYNADYYKPQESDVVEDLLKKMPGVEIDNDGVITVNGKVVKKIMLDGQEFFGDDPKVASKNLPASIIDKLQVLDQKSDMAQLTGFDDDDETTVINLTVKKGMKEGMYGNAFGGAGNKERYETQGMLNYMRNTTKVSAFGGINNTNGAGASDLASAMFNDGGDEEIKGLSFGGRNGIMKSAAGGGNFLSEQSKKFKISGDIRYVTSQNDVVSDSRTEYTTSKNPRKRSAITEGHNESQGLTSGYRIDWQPDSLTKIIFRPRIEYNSNSRDQESNGETLFETRPKRNLETHTRYSMDGKGYKLNGNLTVSRKLSKKGRVVTIGLQGGYNDSEREGFDYNQTNYTAWADSSKILDLHFNQDNISYNWRASASYVEPVGKNNFLELSYALRKNNSEIDKQSFRNDGVGNYVNLDSINTRFTQNDYMYQDVALKFRSVRKNFNYVLGMGVQPSSSTVILYEPGKTDVTLPKRHFFSVIPMAQFNYLWSKRHNFRITYRGNTSQPTTLQLYDGIYTRSGLNTVSGNPNLRPSYTNTINFRYQKFAPQQASSMRLLGEVKFSSNDIVRVSTWNEAGGKDNTFTNVNGNIGGYLRYIYNTPLKNKKFSISTNTYSSYSITNTFIDGEKNRAKSLTLREALKLKYRSKVIDFGVQGHIRYEDLNNTISKKNNRHTFRYGGTADFTLYLPHDFIVQSDLDYTANSGFTKGFEQNEWFWNASIAKKVFKNKAGLIRLKVYDILKERTNIVRRNGIDYIQDTTTNTLTRYGMIHFVYRFQMFKGGAKKKDLKI